MANKSRGPLDSFQTSRENLKQFPVMGRGHRDEQVPEQAVTNGNRQVIDGSVKLTVEGAYAGLRRRR